MRQLILRLVCMSLLGAHAPACGHGPPAAAKQPVAEAKEPELTLAFTDPRCPPLLAEGDALLAAGQKPAARARYEEARSLCVRYPLSRKRLFLLDRGPLPLSPATATAEVTIDTAVIARLKSDVRIRWYGVFIDGDAVPLVNVMPLSFGAHHVTVEIYFEPATPGALGGPARMDLRASLVLPKADPPTAGLRGGLTIVLVDKGGAVPIPQRIAAETGVLPFRDPEAFGALARHQRSIGPHDTEELPVMLAPNMKELFRITQPGEAFPEALTRRAPFWGLFKLCVGSDGNVSEVKTMRALTGADNQAVDPAITGDVISAVMRWKFWSYVHDNRARAFCTPLRVQVPPGPWN